MRNIYYFSSCALSNHLSQQKRIKQTERLTTPHDRRTEEKEAKNNYGLLFPTMRTFIVLLTTGRSCTVTWYVYNSIVRQKSTVAFSVKNLATENELIWKFYQSNEKDLICVALK